MGDRYLNEQKNSEFQVEAWKEKEMVEVRYDIPSTKDKLKEKSDKNNNPKTESEGQEKDLQKGFTGQIVEIKSWDSKDTLKGRIALIKSWHDEDEDFAKIDFGYQFYGKVEERMVG